MGLEELDCEYDFEEDILDYFFEHYDFPSDEHNYLDQLRESVDIYVFKNKTKLWDLVDGFGVFEAIELYNQTYGNYIVADKVSDNYKILAFMIIHETMKEKYSYEKIKEIKDVFY